MCGRTGWLLWPSRSTWFRTKTPGRVCRRIKTKVRHELQAGSDSIGRRRKTTNARPVYSDNRLQLFRVRIRTWLRQTVSKNLSGRALGNKNVICGTLC